MPGPQPQIIEFPLTGGVDQKSAPSKVTPAQLLKAENIAVPKIGTYSKRYGLTAKSTTLQDNTTIAANAVLASYARTGTSGANPSNELLALESKRVLTLGRNAGKWTNIDELPSFTARQRTVAWGSSQNQDPDIAYIQSLGLFCYVWMGDSATVGNRGTIYAQVVDETSGAIVLGPVALSSANAGLTPHVVAVGTTFIVVWVDLSANIKAATLAAGTYPLAFSASSNIITDAVGAGAMDVCVQGSVFAVYYQNSAGSNVSTLRTFNASLVQQLVNSPTDAVTGARIAMSIAPNAVTGGWWGVYVYNNSSTPTVMATAWDSGLTVTSGPTSAFTVTNSSTITCLSVADVSSINSSTSMSQVGITYRPTNNYDVTTIAQVKQPIAVVSGTTRTLQRATLMSRFFVLNGTSWALAYFTTAVSGTLAAGVDPQGTLALFDCYGNGEATGRIPRPACTIAPRQANYSRYLVVASTPASVVADSVGVLHTAASAGRIVVSSGFTLSSKRLSVIDIAFDPGTTNRQTAQLGNLLYVTGGTPCFYDSSRAAEVSFLHYPYIQTINTATSGGSLPDNGQYQWAAVYIHYDAQGNAHRSAPFFSNVVTLGSSGSNICSANLTLTYDNWTLRQESDNNTSKIFVELYRTPNLATNPSVTYRRITAEVALPSGITASSTGTMQNDPSTITFNYVDGATDASFATNPLIYTSGNVLDNVCPPSARLCCTHRNRLFLSGCPDGREIWASKFLVSGEAPGFNEGLILRVDDGGEITAIASMDDKLIVFKSDRLFYYTGDGPDDTGGNSDWSDPIKIISTVGCIEPRSVVVAPFGILFQSQVGISMLSRGLEVSPLFGMAIEDDLATYPVIVSATLHATLPEVRFACQNAGGTAGRELRYDYRAQQWFAANYFMNNTAVQSAVNDGKTYTLITPTPNIYFEDSTTYLDNNNYVSMTCDFPYVKAAGGIGYELVDRVIYDADTKTQHDVTIRVAHDSNSLGAGENEVFTVTSNNVPSPEIIIAHLKQQKVRNVIVRVSDLTPSGAGAIVGTGQGPVIKNLSFSVTPLDGIYKNLGIGAKV